MNRQEVGKLQNQSGPMRQSVAGFQYCFEHTLVDSSSLFVLGWNSVVILGVIVLLYQLGYVRDGPHLFNDFHFTANATLLEIGEWGCA